MRQNDANYLISGLNNLTTEALKMNVSEWAENRRYLPSELSPRPGYWSNEYNPHFVEIMDCLSDSSHVSQLALMKGVQLGATTAAENWVGYTIDESPCAFFYLTADIDLAEVAMDQKVGSMILHCGLSDKIKPSDPKSRRTGNTKLIKEFPGGFIRAVGANSPGKLRSVSVKRFYADELDGMPDQVGKEGDPVKLAEKRTNAYGKRRKMFFTSTPTVMQTSKIYKLYKQGDQRKRYVPCPHCGYKQELVMKGRHEDGRTFGLNVEVDDDGFLIPEKVHYDCCDCGCAILEHHKPVMFLAGEWRPTARPKNKFTRSYHLNTLYSPLGMFSWVDIAQALVDCFDVRRNRVTDVAEYKTFVNTIEGMPWEERGTAPTYERVIAHRRAIYSRNQIPNLAAISETGSPIVMLTAAADCHKRRIDVEIIGWCADGRSYSIDWRHLEPSEVEMVSSDDSPIENLNSKMWADLREIIENERWKSDDGKSFGIALTLVDAGYATDTIKTFCADYSAGVLAIFGRGQMRKSASIKNFYFNDRTNTADINVNMYKDRLAAWLRTDWNDGELQPSGYPNYPEDYGDDYFRQYEAEEKMIEKNRKTGQIIGYNWQKKPNADNHAWDCRVYNMAALDMFALEITRELTEEPKGLRIDYQLFWKWAIENGAGLLWENV